MIRKLFRTLLALLIVVSSFSGTGKTIVHAEDEEIPYSEDPTDIVTELGTSYDVFPQTKPKMLLKAGGTSRLGERMGMIYINNQFGYDYLTYLYVGDKTVFCIEPMQLFVEDMEYTENYTKWDDLSESQRQAIWEINYYGYSYPGHQTDAYYIATQLMIWEVVDQWYDPYYTDGTTPYDISAEVNEIKSLRSNPQGRPSFNNTTIKTGLNMPKTITDTKGVLSNYNIHSGNGVELSANGNDLTVTLTSENFDKSLTLILISDCVSCGGNVIKFFLPPTCGNITALNIPEWCSLIKNAIAEMKYQLRDKTVEKVLQNREAISKNWMILLDNLEQ